MSKRLCETRADDWRRPEIGRRTWDSYKVLESNFLLRLLTWLKLMMIWRKVQGRAKINIETNMLQKVYYKDAVKLSHLCFAPVVAV